jgi:uncharacterized iron-regulated membrane protein
MRRALVVLHRWFGLFTAAFLFLAGLTGAVIAWDHELDAWLNPELFRSASRGTAMSAFALADRIEQDDPRLRVRYLQLTHEPGHSALFAVYPRVDPATGRPFELGFDQVAVDTVSGEARGRRLWGEPAWSRANLLPFLYKLHYSLHIPSALGTEPGVLFMGIVAVVWLLDALIALYISFPEGSPFRRSFAFRLRAGGYRLLFDLHRSGGVWIWPLLLVFALSAVAMNLGRELVRPAVSLLSELTPDPFKDAAAAEPASFVEPRFTRAQIAERARSEAAQRSISAPLGGMFYAPEVGIYGAGFFEPGDEHGDGGLGNPWLYFDGRSGAVVGAQLPGAGSAGDLYLQLQFPLHSGRIAGVPGRIAVTLLGLAIATLSVTGVVIWARKRNARRHAARKRSTTLRRPAPPHGGAAVPSTRELEDSTG